VTQRPYKRTWSIDCYRERRCISCRLSTASGRGASGCVVAIGKPAQFDNRATFNAADRTAQVATQECPPCPGAQISRSRRARRRTASVRAIDSLPFPVVRCDANQRGAFPENSTLDFHYFRKTNQFFQWVPRSDLRPPSRHFWRRRDGDAMMRIPILTARNDFHEG
jgi:hypothetical protein